MAATVAIPFSDGRCVLIIAFSGSDGAGKSTQIARMSRHLQGRGLRPHYIWARGGYTPLMLLSKKIVLRFVGRRGGISGFDKEGSQAYIKRRASLLDRAPVARAWLVVAILDMILLYGVYARLLSARGRIVICDRYTGDTRIDFERNFPKHFNPRSPIWRILTHMAPRPRLHFLLTVPVEISLQRSLLKNEPFPDSPATLSYRLKSYQELPEFKGRTIRPIDGSGDVDLVWEEIQSHLGTLAGLSK